MGGPPNVAAMMTNQIEVSAVLVTLEGLNANVKKPGVAMYISVNSQTKVWKMEQFVVRNGFKAETIADLKGAKLMSAPGPANLNTAKAILAKNGLKDGDYTIDQLDMGQHVNAMTAGTFDGGYTLEPNASMMIKAGVARSLEAGVISKYILGDEKANAYAAGCAMTSDFIAKRPDVAKRFAAAWGKAIDFINKNPDEARKYLAKNTFTPDNVVDMVSMLGYVMAGDMTPQAGRRFAEIGRLRQFDRGRSRKARRHQSPAEILGARGTVAGAQIAAKVDAAARAPDASLRTAPHVTIRGLSKRFADATIYDNFDFDIPRGKLISVFGPNGCGKSTLINMIAGLFPVDAGEILFDGQPISQIRFGYVFQNYREALFPWLRAFDNVAYPLKLMGIARPREHGAGRDVSSPTSTSRSTSISIPIRCPADSSSWSRSCGR